MQIIDRPELKRFSTLKLGGRGRRLYLARSCSDLDELGRVWPEIKDSAFVLGRGSNVLFRDADVDLVLIKWAGGETPQILDESENEVLVEVSASLSLPRFLGWCIKKGLSGLEGLAGIPGTVGGAVAMNAGSHGVEIGSKIEKAKVWVPEQGIFWVDREDTHIAYRHFRLKRTSGFYLILGAILRLGKDDPGEIKKRIASWYERKKKTQPVLQATAGCVFKNPILNPRESNLLAKKKGFDGGVKGVSAGWLLEQAGFRGKRLGGVGFSALHANFLVNYGHGTTSQALELIECAKNKVSKMWGIALEMEVKVVPCL
ncbi:UDP-N-acetylmuramate dehydrogenase [Desulfohalobiaceae bacterium Ax17]|uniref:UDP-N-acetylmuramate dehydrogenase n=1 Tax=Desulfovulcanus ferrireducens TaxID=2831190 RepID=UPI00207BBF5F|nr:UDP-N-acetylmuramate dehydrogenase [Desulfovulcanus ferrireducens]MBT8762731.1 UDP-N-acetylmuramate dehydrogenase [Desulfovulcanus ferrireducens]